MKMCARRSSVVMGCAGARSFCQKLAEEFDPESGRYYELLAAINPSKRRGFSCKKTSFGKPKREESWKRFMLVVTDWMCIKEHTWLRH